MTADGAFTLMRYQVGNLSKSINSSALTASSSSSSASALAMLPLAVQPSPATQITQGAQGGTFRISLSARTPPSRPLTNIKVTLSLGKGANGVTASVSGGGNGLNGASTGAGRWDVTTGPTPTTAGQGQGQGPEGPVLTWTIDSLSSIDRPAEIQGQFYRSVVPPPFAWPIPVQGLGEPLHEPVRANTLPVLLPPILRIPLSTSNTTVLQAVAKSRPLSSSRSTHPTPGSQV